MVVPPPQQSAQLIRLRLGHLPFMNFGVLLGPKDICSTFFWLFSVTDSFQKLVDFCADQKWRFNNVVVKALLTLRYFIPPTGVQRVESGSQPKSVIFQFS